MNDTNMAYEAKEIGKSRLYTSKEIAFLLGIDRDTLSQWRLRGKIPEGVNLGAQYVWSEDDFEKIREVRWSAKVGRPVKKSTSK